MRKTDKRPDALARAENALRLRDFETAERHARACLLEEPESRDARLVLGNVYLRTDRPKDALAAFSSAVVATSYIPWLK